MGLENPLHIAIILVVVLLVFGAKRLPEMGKGLGEGMRSFKSGLGGGDSHAPQQPESKLQQLSAAQEQPASWSSDTAGETTGHTADETTGRTEDRARQPVA